MSGTNWPLVGREREITRLRSSLTDKGGGVVLAGPAGAGKTSLARWSVDHASEMGFTPEWIYATKATSTRRPPGWPHR